MKVAHFSIDDVGASFKYIYYNSPESIFDLRLYSKLMEWHEKYNFVASLYCIVCIDGFRISKLDDRYQEDFRKNKEWLMYGFHSGDDNPFYLDRDYKKSYYEYIDFEQRMRMGHTDTIRLHSWKTTDEQEIFLRESGVKTILCPCDGETRYDSDGIYEKNGIIHRKTDIWIEKANVIDESILKTDKEYVSLFTHEWCFDNQMSKIENAIRILLDNNYVFV